MAAAAATLSILVADDEEGICDLLRVWLKAQGHQVVTVGSAREAVRSTQSDRYDLVITDVVMPDGDGYELIGYLRKCQPAVRILAISGGGRYLQGNDCLRIARGLGAHAAVKKPFNWEQVQAAIEEAMAVSPHGSLVNEAR